MKSSLLIIVRNIGYADALVSVLSLQAAMFLPFGEGKKISISLMNGITGIVICSMILFVGIYLIYFSNKQKGTIKESSREL